MHRQDAFAEVDVFRALADPTRRAVFERLAAGERTVGDLKTGFAVSQPAISQHLAALKRAGLVSERKAGRNIFYRAEPKGLAPLVGWIGRTQAFWNERIGKLDALLEEMDE